MYARRLTVPVTTDGDGNATEYASVDFGLLSQIRYVKAPSGGFAVGVDFAVTVDGTGEGLWTEADVNASATRAPRQATHGIDGAASLYASGGVAVQDKIAIVSDRIKVVITNGGAGKTGVLHFVLV